MTDGHPTDTYGRKQMKTANIIFYCILSKPSKYFYKAMSIDLDGFKIRDTILILGEQQRRDVPPVFVPTQSRSSKRGGFFRRSSKASVSGNTFLKDQKKMPFFYNGLGPPKRNVTLIETRSASSEESQIPNVPPADPQNLALARRGSKDGANGQQSKHAQDLGLSTTVIQ